MTIETKYKIGEEFYGLDENRIKKFHICLIKIKIEERPTETSQKIEYECKFEGGHTWGIVDEQDADKFFVKTKEDFIKTLG